MCWFEAEERNHRSSKGLLRRESAALSLSRSLARSHTDERTRRGSHLTMMTRSRLDGPFRKKPLLKQRIRPRKTNLM